MVVETRFHPRITSAARYSVVLPVCHGGEFLERALSSLQKVTPPAEGFEVIISGKPQVAREIFDRYAKPSWVFVDSRGNRSESLNAACAAAAGSIWVFSDDDCVFPPGWLLKIDDFMHRHPEAAAAGGADVLAQGTTSFDIALDAVLNSWVATGGTRSDRSLKAGAYYPKLWNMTVLAKAVGQIALDGQNGQLIFDPGLPVHEDVDLMDRIRRAKTGAILYAPEIVVEHSRDTTYAEFFKRNAAMARVSRQRKIHVQSHRMMTAALLGLLVLSFLSLWFDTARWVLGAVLSGYAALLLFQGVSGACRKKRAQLLFWIPMLMGSLHLARAIGFILPGGSRTRKS